MKQISRRTFLVQTGTVAALYPMVGMLEGCEPTERNSRLLARGIHINKENGLNLSIYLFNLEFDGNHLVPTSKDAFIVVQLPPQSLHEKYFIQPASNTAPIKQQDAKLSGHSFLAFELWPDWKGKLKKRKIKYRTAELLDWENQSAFKLLSTFDQKGNFQSFASPAVVDQAFIKPTLEKALIQIDHYKSIIAKLLGDDTRYLSFFELPAGLLIAPHKNNKDIAITITQNDYQISDQTFFVYPKDQSPIKRRVLERGNLEMRFIQKIDGTTPITVPPALRAIGLFSDAKFKIPSPSDPCACVTAGIPDDNYLPSLLDEVELLFLNQQSNTEERFDIKAKGPFLLGASGATLKFSYKNHNLDGIDPSISLVEYEHHFQDGRDNFIKVSRIGVIAPTAQKALHVKIAERKEIGGVCFVDYKEFVEIIETDKPFPSPSNKPRVDFKYTAPKEISGAPKLEHYDNQVYFSRITTRFKRTPPIKVVQDCANNFWVYTEFSSGTNADLMQLEFDYYDQNGKKTDKAVKHPIFFMRRDFFCSKDLSSLLTSDMAKFDDGVKFRMNLQDQLIAFTPDDPTLDAQNSGIDNKINQLKAEYSDYYFTVANPIPGIKNVFDRADFVIYPQISRAKVYIDHYQQYSQSPLPSLIKFNKAYLSRFFEVNGNPAKVILEQCPDFMAGKIRNFAGGTDANLETITSLNNGYQRIKEVFNEAGDRTGGMINPGIKNKLIAFGEEGLTYPEDINEQWKQKKNLAKDASVDKVLKAIDIFSTDAEIVGVSIISILGEISDAGGTPAFAADKLLAQIENFEAYVKELTNIPIILEAIAKVEAVSKEIIRLKNIYDAGKTTLLEVTTRLNAAKNDFLTLIPDVNKIKTAAKLAFEKERLNAFNYLNAELAKAKQTAIDEVVREIYNLRPNFDGFKAYLTTHGVTFEGKLKALIAKLPDSEEELKARLMLIDSKVFTDIDAAVAQFKKPLADIKSGRVDILIGVSFETYFSKTDLSEGILLLQEKYDRLLARYIAGEVALKAEVNARRTQLTKLQDSIRNSLYEKVKTILLCYNELIVGITDEVERAAAEQFFSVLRLLSKASFSYYVDKYEEMKRDFADLESTTLSELKNVLKQAEYLAIKKAKEREAKLQEYIGFIVDPKAELQTLKTAWESVGNIEKSVTEEIEKAITDEIKAINLFGAAQKARLIESLKTEFDGAVSTLTTNLKAYEALLVNRAKNVVEQIEKEMYARLEGITDISRIRALKAEFDRIKKILTTPKTEEFKYQWETGNFKTANMGILQFNPQSNPPTKLKADVKTIVHINPLNFPNVIDRIDTYAENSLTNFSLTFLSALTVDFAHLNFVTGSSVKTKMNVGIRDVKFDGALSFVQKLEELMGGLGDGFSIMIRPTNVGIGYTSPVFSISTPGFMFSNISISVILQIFFDRKPMELTFMLAKPEAKATIAAGIYGGGFYCALTAQPKNGLKSIEMAIEMGAIVGIQLGPIKGEVRFMIGLFFRKDDTGVILEGYFVAEGVLSVWIISASAKLYMYVRSHNSYVTGGCKVTYSAKLGFVRKSFTGSYSKKLAGAESKRSSNERSGLSSLVKTLRETENDLFDYSFLEDEYQALTSSEWTKFNHTFYRH
ncbi:hypothetical protein D3C87_593440 [compost metagenome]|uniref:hypothetical protein n=1 Tax=Pedobacter ghigonis TaxID=2730403 RepID=UPI000FB805C0|nr:hypothetical protein [Pedobacter ghigonis]